jgi:hypothetical protein
LLPITSANVGLGVKGAMNAALGFLADFFLGAAFFLAAFFGAAFFAAFLGAAFFAAFLGAAFFAPFFAAFFAVAITFKI